ncbi:Nicotianamine synthase [Backusella circina FSU 941]|nr:Nicotianamine synthase [Backusella circina FSU 941]
MVNQVLYLSPLQSQDILKTKKISETLIDELCIIHGFLEEQHDLAPCTQVNAIFTKLVQICIQVYRPEVAETVLQDPRVLAILPSLRNLASEGEYQLEMYWTKILTDVAEDQSPCIEKFVYHQNYQDLVQMEIRALEGVGATLQNIMFIGSGPLPLSSIIMAQNLPESNIYNIDHCQKAIQISATLITQMGLQNQIESVAANASEFKDFQKADVVVLGALVGQDAYEKTNFLKWISGQMKKGAYVMIRSAHSLRKVLYPSIEPYEVNDCGFETQAVLHPYNDVVNSVVIAKKLY